MAHQAKKGSYAVLALWLGLGLIGCGQEVSTDPSASQQPEQKQTAKNDEGKPTSPSSKDAEPKTNTPVILQPSSAKVADEETLHQSFADATRDGEEPPASSNLPPDRTLAGKSVYKVFKEVQAQWDSIRFNNDEGTRIDYLVTLKTRMGDVQILFFPDVAPNHVRNFLALAKTGYYDGLAFERVGREVLTDTETINGQAGVLEQIQAGCPRGTGELGYGHLGYWLAPEFSEEMTHDEGTVGACRALEPDSAGCRFYITLTKAPFLDGHYTVFGKVTKGLDIVRKIYEQPVVGETTPREGSYQPVDPVKIEKVIIETYERQ